MQHFNAKVFFIAFFLQCTINIFAADIGSDSAVSRFNTQVSISSGDRIAGFAAMGGGLILDTAVEAVFDSFFEVSGPVNIAAGTLCLNRDLRFRDPASFDRAGNVIGNDHTLSLSQTVTLLPRLPFCSPEEVASVTPNPTPFVVSCAWSFDDTYVMAGIERVGAAELYVYTFDQDTNVLTLFSSGQLQGGTEDAVDLSWHPNRNLFAVAGRVRESTAVGSLHLFENTVTTLTELQDINSVFSEAVSSVAWHPTGDWLAVGSTGSIPGEVAIFFFDTATERLVTTPVVTVTLGRNVEDRAVDWDATGTYLAVGTGVDGSADELVVFEFDRTNSTLIINASANTGADTVVSWNQTNANILAVGEDLGFVTSPVIVYQHDKGSGGGAQDGTLTNKIETSVDEGVQSINWSPDGECLGAVIFRGTGSIETMTVWTFDSDNFVLEKVFTHFSSTFGTIFDINWSNNGDFIAIAEAGDRDLAIFKDLDQAHLMSFSNLQFVINNELTIQSKRLLFIGENIFDGNKNVLTLDSDISALMPDTNSTLHLKNITIEQVNASKIRNTDTTSTITLEDLTLVLDGNFSFTLGQVDIVGTVNIVGDGFTLTWESDQELTIGTDSKLILGEGVTFDYDPTGNSRNLLVFTDNSSELVMSQDSTLNAGTSGINLTKGTLVVNANATLSAESSTAASEITFGDGSTSSNDIKVEIGNAVELQLSQGALDHNNVSSSSVNFGNNISKLSMAASTVLRINQTINTGDGLIEFGNGATVAFASGKQITGNIVPLGTLTYGTL